MVPFGGTCFQVFRGATVPVVATRYAAAHEAPIQTMCRKCSRVNVCLFRERKHKHYQTVGRKGEWFAESFHGEGGSQPLAKTLAM
eukprot:6196323-Pleurochrysis_carterae.AAC.1